MTFYYFSKLSLNNNNNFEFKLNSSTLCKKINNLKNGDNYYFFEFKDNDENLNTFLQHLEDKVIETLYEKSEEWFENNVTIDDIKDSTYGFIKNNKGKINIKLKINCDTYDANSIVLNDKVVSVDEFNLLDYIVPIVQLKGIKFNPKNFYKKITNYKNFICINALHGPFGEDGQTQKIFWQGPSIGWGVGGHASKVITLVYNLKNPKDIFRRYPGVDGSLYFFAGASLNYQSAGDVILAPIRTGVGMRYGANIGYLHYSKEHSWFPF